jgi:hypothetical protein
MAVAQVGRGTIQGIVSDSTGAIVVGAAVQIIQIDTNNTFELVTNTEGLYIAPNLPVGTYRVVVKQPGFATLTREPITVRAEVVLGLDFKIQPGAVTETVNITGEAPLLDLSASSSPTTITKEVFESLPVISAGSKRNITQLLLNVPGLTSYDPRNRESTTWTPRMNGSVNGNTETFIDGGPGSGISTGRGALEEVGPMVETVGEFSVVANAFNAEYGGFGSFFTNVTIRSGTNQVHGSVFNHFANNAMNARSFFQPRITAGNQNEGGFTLGGPVVIPKLYDGRNKTFFFISQGLYFTRNGPSLDLRTIPTSEFQRGDFSKLVNAGAVIPVFDPSSTRADGQGGFVRDQFPNNVIPTSRISPAAQRVVSFMPAPDLPNALVQNFYSRAFSGKYWPFFNSNVTTLKLDHSMSSKQKLSFTYMNQIRHRQLQGENVGWTNRIPWDSVQENPLDFIMFQQANSWKLRLNHDYVITPALLNRVTLSTDRYVNLGLNATRGGDWLQKLNLTGIPADNGMFPAITFTGGTAASMAINRAYDNTSFETRYRIDENLMWLRGKHSMKFGFAASWLQLNQLAQGGASGAFTFSNLQTSQPNAGANQGRWGHSFASFLLGAVDTASATIPDMFGTRVKNFSVFAQDDWRVTTKLTLSYGLRWDYTAPGSEAHNRYSSFQSDLKNPGANQIAGALAFARTYGQPFQDTWKNGFGPRFGLAYQMGHNTVLRASGGLYYAAPAYGIYHAGYTNTPTFNSPDGYSPIYDWDVESFPQSFVRPPVENPSFLNGQAISYVPRNRNRLPQIASWTIGLQKQLGSATTFDVAYLGSSSTHINIGTQINAVDPSRLALGSLLVQSITSAAARSAGFTEPFPGFASQRGANTVAQSLKPYPQYTQVNWINSPDGVGNMHSLQIRANRRLATGLTVNSYFTWMKVMTNNASQNPLDRNSGVGVDFASVPAVFGATWTYELPFGKGKRFGAGAGPLLNRLIGNWSMNGFVRYQSGYALSVTAPNTMAALGYSTTYANYAGGTAHAVTNPRDFDPGKDRYLNSAAFSIPGTYAFGNLAPRLDWLRGFTSKAEALQLAKRTRINERFGIDLGADFSNPFNFHRWADPATNIADSLNFGRVTAAGEGRVIQLNLKVLF